ncbi:processed acidic surface protein [Paenisporosarcina indica]|uniref:processed acidic surface protein n=1 Tax=Paenisporosarcina indica TaxID=650093 RepID=UPI00094F80F3|nr:processed acidic surface protein [Paenisporosarcina indica]
MKKISLSLIAILIAFYLLPANAFAQINDNDLTVYLTKISEERGHSITKDEYEIYLAEYPQFVLSDFENIQELEEYMGPVIKSDHSNLNIIYEDLELNEQQLIDILLENGKIIEDYIYVDDLYFTVLDSQMEYELPDPEDIVGDMDDVMKEIDLTDEEIENLMNHLLSIESELNSPEVGDRLMSIAERMMGIDPENPTEEQISDVGNAFEELLSIFKMKAEFYIVYGDTTTPVSMGELMQMEVLDGDYLLIKLFDLNGILLADLKFTSDDIKEVPENIAEITDIAKEEVNAEKTPVRPQTIKGGKLPATDSNNLDGALAGAVLFGFGLFLYRRVRTS